MRFYKSFLFLLALNLLFLVPVYLFLHVRFLIPLVLALLILDLFLLFFIGFYLRRKLVFSSFPPEDSYGVSQTFKDLKTAHNLQNVYLFNVKDQSCCFCYFSYGFQSFILLSEDLLENLPKSSIKKLLSYPLYLIQSGDIVFLTLLSGFLFLTEKIIYVLSWPFSFLKKKKNRRDSLFLALLVKILSFMITKRIFFQSDKHLFSDPEEKQKQALALFQLASLTQISPPQVGFFLTPLFLTNPLTKSSLFCYIAFQPSMKGRVKSISGRYPP